MCGITGILDLKQGIISTSILKQMTLELRHRGPDDTDIYVGKGVGLGHTRLSIIDLSNKAKQPMQSQDERYVLVYNGEIYNFKEIKKELLEKGHRFVSDSDTEVLLNAWIEWNENCLLRLNGMFAFAIWDNKLKKLVLARDRYGIKPLYYTQINNIVLFGSEIKAILKHPRYHKDIDQETLIEYFTFQNIFTDKTLFKNINTLPAASFLTIDLNSQTILPSKKYWDYFFKVDSAMGSELECAEELDRLFNQSLQRQLVADVPVGSYLSGGMDSGSIVAVASKYNTNLKTFTCGFDTSAATEMELEFDERHNANSMSRIFNTKHYEVVLDANDIENIMPDLTWHLEDLRVGQSYPNFYVASLAQKHVKVVLSGSGGDEVFGGYPWRYYKTVGRHEFKSFIDDYYLFWQRLIPSDLRSKIFTPIQSTFNNISTKDILKNVFNERHSGFNEPEDYIDHSFYFEFKTFLHGLLLVEDKLSMAHGLEVRFPFLDNDLVDFSLKLPVKYKLGHLPAAEGLNKNSKRSNEGKLILRKAMQRHLPKEVINRCKQGFSAPDASWFRGKSMGYVQKKLFNPNAFINQYLDTKIVKNLVGEHNSGNQNRRLLIWSLLNVEQWGQTFMM
ncbi:asparagine synthase (glutamine-hydrolyzing) [bacterium K02(2017)]|nr:asparagine synthase (glutamine-hydrolyzing) [bacterium K02(2017)]